MPLHLDRFLLSDIGIFGISMRSDKEDRISTVRLTCGPQSFRQKDSMGSGYFLLFAKHLACGYLPFAAHHRGRMVETIVVEDYVLDGIKYDITITDNDSNSQWESVLEYLDRLPGAILNNFYAGTKSDKF